MLVLENSQRLASLALFSLALAFRSKLPSTLGDILGLPVFPAGPFFLELVHRSQQRATGVASRLSDSARAHADSLLSQFNVSARDVRGPTEELEY